MKTLPIDKIKGQKVSSSKKKVEAKPDPGPSRAEFQSLVRLVEASISSVKTQAPQVTVEAPNPPRKWEFTVERGTDGKVLRITAERVD